jgi:hypothetical protein
VKISSEIIGQKLELKATAMYEIPEQQMKLFKSREALKTLNEFLKKQTSVQATLNNPGVGSPSKKAAGKTLDQLKKPVEFLQDLKGIYEALNNKGKIHYRVFILYGKDNKVELFNTQVPVVQPVEVKDDNQNSALQSETEQQPPKKPPKKPSAKKKPQ